VSTSSSLPFEALRSPQALEESGSIELTAEVLGVEDLSEVEQTPPQVVGRVDKIKSLHLMKA